MLKLYRSNRLEALADALADVVARPVGDVLEPEQVVVPSRGMERWLQMRLAERFGVCANFEFPFPAAALARAAEAALGEAALGSEAWRTDRLVWAVLSLLPELLGGAAFEPLARYVEDDPTSRKRFELAQRIADTFDRYGTYRPDLVLGWDRGEPGDWQAELWRALRERQSSPHPARVRSRFLGRLAEVAEPPARLPARLSLFGVSSLPPAYLEQLSALSRACDVHLFVLCPSDAWWADVRSRREIIRELAASGGTADEEELHLDEGHPLLGSLGRLARDFQFLLEGGDYTEPRGDLFVDSGTRCALHALQSDIADLRLRGRTPGAPPLELDPSDASIRIHACHGPMRQVEVLADELAGLFEELPDLQPRDVVVMMPDVDTWAPLIEAVFERDPDDPRYVPWHIADRASRRDNPIARAILRLLELVDGRLGASELLDLLVFEPVRRRFGIAVEELELLTRWVGESGVRWGVDEAHRAEHGQPELAGNTWRFGLDRLLLGVAMEGDGRRLFAGTLPVDEVEGTVAQLLGRFAAFCETVFDAARTLGEGSRTLDRWHDLLVADPDGTPLFDRLLAPDEDDARHAQRVRAAVRGLAEAAGEFDAPVNLDVYRYLLQSRLSEPPPPHGFLGGAVTFCALVPMRAIPFSVVCLVGLDDEAFPRQGPRLGFDLVVREPRRGDRPPREDDRALFLDVLLAARERLVITYSGRSPRSGEELPPAVPVVELLDALCDGLLLPGMQPGEPARSAVRRQLVVEHPLQPFSPRCFGADPRLSSFALEYLPGARALQGDKCAPPPFIAGRLAQPADAKDPIRLEELAAFFAGPVPFLVQRRLGVDLTPASPTVEDREPLELGPLQAWSIGEALVRRRLGGEDVAGAFESVRAGGRLPLGVPGRCRFEELLPEALSVALLAAQRMAGAPDGTVEVDLDLDGARLVGRLDRLSPGGLIRSGYARVKPARLLSLWVSHLALQLAAGATTSALVGRPEGGGPGASEVLLRPVSKAAEPLAHLISLYRAGQTEPLLLFPATSKAWAEVVHERPDAVAQAEKKARRTWIRTVRGGRDTIGEGTDPHVLRVLGDGEPFGHAPLLGPVPPPERTFAALALSVWGPLLDHVVVT